MDVKTCISTNFDKLSRKLAHAIVTAINDLEDHWPLTVRQVYYQMVARLIVENNQDQYRRMSRVLLKLREVDLVK